MRISQKSSQLKDNKLREMSKLQRDERAMSYSLLRKKILLHSSAKIHHTAQLLCFLQHILRKEGVKLYRLKPVLSLILTLRHRFIP